MSLLQDYKKDFADFENAKPRITKLIQVWDDEKNETKARRDLRNVAVDVEGERLQGTLDQDELYIPIRTIDTNIKREQASYIAFIKQARRQAIFKCINNASLDTTPLEKDFTDKSRYDGWEIPYYELIDGFQAHGWDAVEIEADPKKPGQFAITHIGHENLIFTVGALNIQDLEFVCIRKYYSAYQLIGLTQTSDNPFNAEEVEKVLQGSSNDKDTTGCDSGMYEIYKVFFKKGGIVYVAWTGSPQLCSAWLRAPKPLFLGKRDPVYGIDGTIVAWNNTKETDYPIVVFPYLAVESGKITDVKGRAYYDEYVQTGASSLLSSFVTQHRRACNVYVSGESLSDDGSPSQTNIKVIPGQIILGRSITFTTMPAPSPDMMNAVHGLVSQNQNEQSQVNYAATNRKDSRKTAEEIKTAQAESALLSSVQVSLFSISFRRVCLMTYAIYKSNVLQGLAVPTCDMKFFTDYQYVIYSSGDQDVIERRERILQMMQTWPVVQQMGPGFALEYFKDLITLMFPEMAQKYTALLGQDTSLQTKISGLQQVLKAVITDPDTGELVEQAMPYKEQLTQIINNEAA